VGALKNVEEGYAGNVDKEHSTLVALLSLS
jgi:hypothetical protein